MDCVECGHGGAEQFQVEYVEANSETLRLCEECRALFEQGDLVTDVSPIADGGGQC